MPERFDDSLLVSPLDDSEQTRRPFIFGVVAAVVAAGLAVTAWMLLSSTDDPASDSGETGAVAATVTVSTTASPLVARETDEQLLYHPALLPAGMELCASSLGRPTTGDEFCDADDPSRLIEVSTPMIEVSGGEPIDGSPGLRLISAVEPYEIGANDVRIVATASGIGLDQLVEVVSTIPLVDPDVWVPPDEAPITEEISDDFIYQLLGAALGELDIRRTHGQIDVYGRDLNLYSAPTGPEAGGDIRLMAAGLVHPVSVSENRAFVVGGTEPQGSTAMWYQRGRYWQVTSARNWGVLLGQVPNMEAMIASLS